MYLQHQFYDTNVDLVIYFLFVGVLERDLRNLLFLTGDGLFVPDLLEMDCGGERCFRRCRSLDRDREDVLVWWWWWRWWGRRCLPGERDRCRILDELLRDDKGGGDPSEEPPSVSRASPRLLRAVVTGEPGSESVGLLCRSLTLLEKCDSLDATEPFAASDAAVDDDTLVAGAGDSLIMLRNLARRFFRSSCSCLPGESRSFETKASD